MCVCVWLCVGGGVQVLYLGTVRTNLDPFTQHDDDAIWRALGRVVMEAAVKVLAAPLPSFPFPPHRLRSEPSEPSGARWDASSTVIFVVKLYCFFLFCSDICVEGCVCVSPFIIHFVSHYTFCFPRPGHGRRPGRRGDGKWGEFFRRPTVTIVSGARLVAQIADFGHGRGDRFDRHGE